MGDEGRNGGQPVQFEVYRITCRQFVDFLADYFDGGLSGRPRRAFDAHLRRCSACADYLAGYRETIILSRSLRADDFLCAAPEALVRAVVAALNETTN